MVNLIYLLNNTILIVVCTIMTLVFLMVPLPDIKGLKEYRISLRIMAFSYFTLSILTLLNLIQGTAKNDITIDLTALSLQTILFSFSLINLFNSAYANIVLVLKHSLPTVIYLILSFFILIIWGEQPNYSVIHFYKTPFHPAAILNFIFFLFCMAQILYFLLVFITQAKLYASKIENYFSDTQQIRLMWVRYLFTGALILALLMLTSKLIESPIFGVIIIGVDILFYALFGLFYIQYPRTFSSIEPVVHASDPANDSGSESNNRMMNWEKLKSKIIEEKYFLRQGVNIEDMAIFLKIGRTKLSTHINKEEGLNFHAWINALRIAEAQQLLISKPDYTIAQIADMIGFSEQTNFSRQFKIHTNLTPSDWRQVHKH